MSKLEPEWVYTPNAEKLGAFYDAQSDGEGGVYLLVKESTSAILIHVNKDGEELFRRNIEFGASSIAVTKEGIYSVGFHYRNAPYKSGVIYTPDIALFDKKGNIKWHNIPLPPFEVEDLGKKKSIWDLESTGDINLWKVVSMLDSGCIAMGEIHSDKKHLLYHIRIDKKGKITWHSYIPAEINWIYFYPNKIEPHIKIFEDYLISLGAATLETGSLFSAIKLRLSDGKIISQFTPALEHSYNYTCSSFNQETSEIAIGYFNNKQENGILILDNNLGLITDLDTPIRSWIGLDWVSKNEIWIGGNVKSERQFINHPGYALIEFDPSGKVDIKLKKVFKNEMIYDKLVLNPTNDGCFISYIQNNSERPDIIDRTSIVTRIEGPNGGIEQNFCHKEGLHDNLRMISTKDGHYVIFEWNDSYPVLCKYAV